MASAKGHEKVVLILLDRGADINAQQEMWGTALHVACCEGHEKVVQILLDQGADINANAMLNCPEEQGTPLNAALLLDRRKIVNLLLNRGAVKTEQDVAFSKPGFLERIQRHLRTIDAS